LIPCLHAATGRDAEERMAGERSAWGYGDDLDVGVTGDAPAVADAVRWWAGADTVVLDPTRDDPDPEGFVRFVAQRVRPLV
jgi:hypothetical protein